MLANQQSLSPPHLAPLPAWTKQIDGKAYTVKRVGDNAFSIWHHAEELGSFELSPHLPPTLKDSPQLSLEARAVARAFVEAYQGEDGSKHAASRSES